MPLICRNIFTTNSSYWRFDLCGHRHRYTLSHLAVFLLLKISEMTDLGKNTQSSQNIFKTCKVLRKSTRGLREEIPRQSHTDLPKWKAKNKTNASRYAPNEELHRDLIISTVEEEIRKVADMKIDFIKTLTLNLFCSWPTGIL